MSATAVATPPGADREAEEPATGRRWPKLLLLAVLLVCAAAVAWWFLLRPDPVAAGEVVEGEIITLEPMTTTTGESTLHHARVGLAVVLTEQGRRDDIAERTPLLQDALLTAVAERDADTLRSAAGSEELRVQMTREAQRIWSEEEISRIVLVELLVQ